MTKEKQNNTAEPSVRELSAKETGCIKSHVFVDISGRHYRRLTALYPTPQRSKKGYVIWHCRCDCGNEVDVSYNDLIYGNMKSCGCQKKEHDQQLRGHLTHAGGTSLEMIRSRKVPVDNTSGHRGVYLIKGKYVAKIVFQKKGYYLGVFDNIDDAVQARRQAEEDVFGATAEYLTEWKRLADGDPEWAGQNPVRITVTQDADKRLSVSFLPVISAEEYAAR